MKKQYTVRVAVILFILLLSFLYAFPSTETWGKTFGILTIEEQTAVPRRMVSFDGPKEGIPGSTVTLEADPACAFITGKKGLRSEDFLNSVAETVRKSFLDAGFIARVTNPEYSSGKISLRVSKQDPQGAEIQIGSAGEVQQAFDMLPLYARLPLGLAKAFPRSRITLGLDLRGGIDLVYKIDLASLEEKDNPEDAVSRAIEIIRNRIDMYGVAEPTIKAQDGHRIRIQLPGVQNPDRVKSLIQSTAMLKFHLVEEGPAQSPTMLEPVGPDHLVLMEPGDAKRPAYWYKLRRKAEVSGRDLKFANPTFGDMGNPIVQLEFNAEGAAKFARVTGDNIGALLAIVLDDRIYSAPRIEDRIPAGMAVIRGSFTLEEAQNLSIVLRAGALPANLLLLESRVVGPTLGKESIDAGTKAGILGSMFVILFMAVFYKVSGIFADLAVAFNTLITFSTLVFFGGTLTLPGIAGLILSIGMAVDANVIIFERIREELRTGKTVRAAISAGFDRALSCIIDSNLTTLLTVVVLYIFGSGPIRGFATTLGIGLVANVFTAVVCVKLALEVFYGHSKSATMSI